MVVEIFALVFYFMTLLIADWTEGNFLHDTVAYSQYDFRESNYTNLLASNTGFLSQVSDDLNPNGSPVTDNSFYYTTTSYTRGGRTSNYSRRDYFPDCQYIFSDITVGVNYYFPKIVFTSDGECGSTCNSVITHLKDTNSIQTLTYGGLLGLDLDIASFAGGNVVDWSDFVTTIVANTNYASLMTCSASVRFAHHEVYATGATTPREYLRQPSDYHAYMWEPVYDNFQYLATTVSVADFIFSNATFPVNASNILVPEFLILVISILSFVLL